MNIHTTKDYSKFKIILGNRPLSRSNLKKITKSIANKNMLSIAPIVVNADLEIIDGQHRFQIAKENRFPIHYIVLKDGNLSDVHSLNNISRKWSTEDYIKSYSVQGKSSYKKLLKYMEDFDLPYSIAIILLGVKETGHNYTNLKSGDLQLQDSAIAKGEEMASYYNTIVTFFEGQRARGEYLARALKVVDIKGLLDKLVKILDDRKVKLVHQPSVVEYLREFENVLNWKKRTEKGNMIRLF